MVGSPKKSFPLNTTTSKMTDSSLHTKNDMELIKLRHQVWAKAIDTQMHFNQMSLQSRQLGMSFAVGALGFCAFMLTRDIHFNLGGLTFHTLNATAIVLWMVALTLVPIGILDLFVYQRLLRGAVKFAWELEHKKLVKDILGTDYGMSTYISMSDGALTQDMLAGVETRHAVAPGLVESKPFFTAQNLRAPHLIGAFYVIMISLLLAIGAVLWTFDMGTKINIAPAPDKTQRM